MAEMTFMEKLEAKWAEGKHECVGLDPIEEKLPADLLGFAKVRHSDEDIAGAMSEAMIRVINVTADIAAAYKPNSAFFEEYLAPGWDALKRVIKHAKDAGVPVILDAKRGDIGNTNERYARMAEKIGADAMTIHPYLGWEANQPFLDRAGMGIFVLCRTSNPGAGEFQDLPVVRPDTEWEAGNRRNTMNATSYTMPLYQRVAAAVANPETWNRHGNCGLVTGATYPAEIAAVRQIAPDLVLLIPGIGKQGGDLEASVSAARHRFLINSSSGIIFADDPRAETIKLHEGIQQALAKLG